MANKIILKKSSVASKVPLATDLEVGEISVNLTDQKLYSKNASGTVILVGQGVSGSGDVVGGSSSTDNAIARYDGTTGKLIQNSVVTVSDTGSLSGILSETFDTVTTPPTIVEGLEAWDSGNGTLEVGLKGGNVSYKYGQQEFVRAYNGSGSAMTKGQIVYIVGAQGNRVDVRLALATSDATSAGTIGWVAEAIANGAEGFVQVSGTLPKLDTSTLTAGQTLYLSPTTAGAYTTTRPTAPNHTVVLGWVERVSATVGSVYIKVDNGYELDELHNVLITSPTAGQQLVYNNTTGVWNNSNAPTITGGSITVADTNFTLQDNTDATKQAKFELSSVPTASTVTYTLPAGIAGASTLVDLSTSQTINGYKVFSNPQLVLGNSTASSTYNLASGATISGATKALNIGTGGVAGSTTAISIGSTNSTTVTANGNWTFPSTITGSVSGSASTLTTGRTISTTGDVTYTSGAFNGSADVTGTATLASVGTSGTYTKVTTDAKGRVTSGTTLSASDIPNLDASKITTGTIDPARLPSYVDDILEYANLASFPATGETGKIYIALDTNKTYRWSGTVYVYITSGAVDSVGGYTGVVTATNLLDAIKTVDGASSGLDADTLDGNHASAFYLATNPNGYTTNTGTVTSVGMTVPTGLTVTGSPITTSGTLALSLTAGYSIPTTASQTNWDSAYTQRLQWDGSSTNLVASTGRTSLGATTVGSNLFTLTNPSAVTFLRVNADNTVSALDASTFRTAIGAGTGSGTVTGVTATSPVASSGGNAPVISLSSGYGDTLNPYASKTMNMVLASPQNADGVPSFRNLHLSDMPSAWIKRAVNATTTGALTLNTAQTTIDGVTLSATSRVLVKDQATASQNGIYTNMTTTTWVRATDADSAGDIAGAFVNVDAGTVNGGKVFDTDFKSTDTIGTTAMNWYQNIDRGYLTTVGNSFATLTNPSAITFPRMNADNTVSALDATTFRTAIGAGTSSTNGTVTSVSALTLGTTGTDVSSTVATGTTTPVITLNIPTASATNRGALSSTDWSTFNNKQATLVSGTNIKTINGTTILGSGNLVVSGLASIATTAPSSPVAGQLWWNSEEGNLKVYYTDANTSQWIDASVGTVGAQGIQGVAGADGADGLGVPTGGTVGQALVKNSSTDNDTSWTTLTLSNLPDAWVKKACRVATTANITLSGTQTIDGIAVVAGDRVLVKDQSTQSQNGIYDVSASTWTRSADANTASYIAGALVSVDLGTVNGGKAFDCDFKSTDTLGTTAITWNRMLDSGSGDLYYRRNTATTLASSTANQSWLGLTNGVTVASSTIYEFEGYFELTTSGTTSHTERLLFGLTTATLADINYTVVRHVNSTTATSPISNTFNVATASTVTGSITTAQDVNYYIKGTFSVNTGGQVNPQMSFSAAPSGTSTITAGAYFKLKALGTTGTDAFNGTWS